MGCVLPSQVHSRPTIRVQRQIRRSLQVACVGGMGAICRSTSVGVVPTLRRSLPEPSTTFVTHYVSFTNGNRVGTIYRTSLFPITEGPSCRQKYIRPQRSAARPRAVRCRRRPPGPASSSTPSPRTISKSLPRLQQSDRKMPANWFDMVYLRYSPSTTCVDGYTIPSPRSVEVSKVRPADPNH